MDMMKKTSNEAKKPMKIDIEKMDQQLEKFLERAWLVKEEENSQQLIKTLDLGAWEIDSLKFQINKMIAKGAYGSVYQGIYQNKKVAVKVFHLAGKSEKSLLKESFVQEVSLSMDLDHPNIIKFIGAMKNMSQVNIKVKKSQDFDTTQDCCIVSEFLPRGTLYQYLRRRYKKKLPISTVIQFALDIAEGLSYLHSKKIMHRDVKTDNMLLDKKGKVKLIDFGVSGVEDLIENTSDTGTHGYMAPEVFAGNVYDHKCDVYSFGICLWEIYSCQSAYGLSTMYAATILDNPNDYKDLRPKVPESCPSALADLMKQCWDANPKKRPEMTTVVRILKEFATYTSSYQGGKGPSWLSCLG